MFRVILALLVALSLIPAFAASAPKRFAIDESALAIAAVAVPTTAHVAPVAAKRAAGPPPDPFETCVAHGGVSELYWGLMLTEGESGLRWCNHGHMASIYWLQPWFVMSLLNLVN